MAPDTERYVLNHYDHRESVVAGRRIFSEKVNGTQVVEIYLDEFARHLGAGAQEIERVLCAHGFRLEPKPVSKKRIGFRIYPEPMPKPEPEPKKRVGWKLIQGIRDWFFNPPQPTVRVEPPVPVERPAPRFEVIAVAKAVPPPGVPKKMPLTVPPPPAPLLHCSECGRLLSDHEWGEAGYFGGQCVKCRGNEYLMTVPGTRDPGGTKGTG